MLAWGRTQILRGWPECYMTLTHKMKIEVTSQDRSPKLVTRVWVVIWIRPDGNGKSFYVFSKCTLWSYGAWLLGTFVLDKFEFLGQSFNVFVIAFLFVIEQSTSPHCHDDQMSWYMCFEKLRCNNNAEITNSYLK